MTSTYGDPIHKFKPISKLVNETYGLDKNILDFDALLKEDAPVITTTTGVRNTIYGAKIFNQLCLEWNVFAALPKFDMEKSGFRVITTAADSTGGGIAENAAIPDTTKPTFALVATGNKEMATSFEMSLKNLNMETKDDSIKWAQLVDHMGNEHKQLINTNLCTDNDTLAGNNIESIDRAVGSYAEIAAMSQTANDLDFQGLNRDAGATWADAQVDYATTDRALTTKLVRDLIVACEPYWDRYSNKVFITGYDTAADLAALYEPQQRFQDYVNIDTSFNGVKVVGRDTGFRVATFDGIPILKSKDIAKDGASRIYLLDLDYIGIGMVQPTTYMQSDQYLELDKFGRKAAYYTGAELIATKFKCHGKIRDLA